MKNYIDYYEKNFANYEDAKKCLEIVGHGQIKKFLSTDEHGKIITIYSVIYPILF